MAGNYNGYRTVMDCSEDRQVWWMPICWPRRSACPLDEQSVAVWVGYWARCSVSARLVTSATEQYISGVFRISLVEPETVEAL